MHQGQLLLSAGNPDDWHKTIKLDLEVPMRLTRRLSPAMVRTGCLTALLRWTCTAVSDTMRVASVVILQSAYDMRHVNAFP